jgi:hypothetical protein
VRQCRPRLSRVPRIPTFAEHATIVAERVDGFRQNLTDILTVNATLVTQAQNEELKALSESTYDQNEQVKRISAWAAILFAPTLIGAVRCMDRTPDATEDGVQPAIRWKATTARYFYAVARTTLDCHPRKPWISYCGAASASVFAQYDSRAISHKKNSPTSLACTAPSLAELSEGRLV